ncbi:uncharacterized protein ACIBXB_000200 isoform 2-T2 [Morphnus guianensis]
MDVDKKHPIVHTAIWEQLCLLKEHLQYILKINSACKSLHYVIDPVGPGGDMTTLENLLVQGHMDTEGWISSFLSCRFPASGDSSENSVAVPSAVCHYNQMF